MEIAKILNSRLGQKLIAFFFSHEEEEYYLRELALLIGEDPANLSKIMKICLIQGLFNARVKGNEKFFKLNITYPLYQEIKSFVAKTIGIKARLTAEIKKIKGVKKAYVFGSMARGNTSSASDIDLLITGDIDENTLLKKLNNLEKEFAREINYVLLTEKELTERQKNDSFIKSVMDGPKMVLL